MSGLTCPALTKGTQGQPDAPLGVHDELPHAADSRMVNHSAYQWRTKETLARLDLWSDPLEMVPLYRGGGQVGKTMSSADTG